MAEVRPDILRRLQMPEYMADVDVCCGQPVSWGKLADKTILVTGATGMIGTFLVDALMRKNDEGLGCNIVAVGRSVRKARGRLPYFDRSDFSFVEADICDKGLQIDCGSDYIVHLASTTHPVAYASDPVGTIESNLVGLSNLLDSHAKYAAGKSGRVLFASSVEVYGENRGDVEYFDESYCGYINCNTLRAGYPEAKRLCEAMCQAYIKQHDLDIVIPRLPRTYGPTMLWSDTKAISQFLKNGIMHEDIVLKSEGNQLYSYLYVADTVSALLWCLLEGECGEAYNAADAGSDVSLRDLAECIASAAGTEVVFDIPDEAERLGYSKATKAIMDAGKLKQLGWRAEFGIAEGIGKTMSAFKAMADLDMQDR